MNGRSILIWGGAGLVGLACGTTRLDAGSKGDGGTPSTDDWRRGVPWPGTPSNSFDVKCDLPAPDWLAGAWQGELDAVTWPSGSKAVRIEFTGANGTAPIGWPYGLCGTVTFGEGVPPPVATDPQAPPPGGNGKLLTPSVEGFAYEFISDPAASFDAGASVPPFSGLGDRRVRFGITPDQIYKSWCNLQLSYDQFDPSTGDPSSPLPPGLAHCVPPSALSPSSGGRFCSDSGFKPVGFSCAQALYCFLDVCQCNFYGQAGCTVLPSGTTKFDLSLAGTILSGNALFFESVDGLHLTRVP